MNQSKPTPAEEERTQIVLCSHRFPQGVILPSGYVLKCFPLMGPESSGGGRFLLRFDVVAVYERRRGDPPSGPGLHDERGPIDDHGQPVDRSTEGGEA